MPHVQSLRSHLLAELCSLLDAEQQIAKALPQLASGATTRALRVAFQHHLGETETHVHRLKQAFEALGESAQPKRCDGVRALLHEGNAVMNSTPPGALRDAVMITSAQKVEHYEIASYGTARTYAQVLGQPEVARLLQETLGEEQAADTNLTTIAERKVNQKATEEWHQDQAAAGLLEQTATIAGQAVGIGARTLKRAAGAFGLGKTSSSADTVLATAQNQISAIAQDAQPAPHRGRATSGRRRVKPQTTSSAKGRRTNARTRKSRSGE